jgi:hypothetical protein
MEMITVSYNADGGSSMPEGPETELVLVCGADRPATATVVVDDPAVHHALAQPAQVVGDEHRPAPAQSPGVCSTRREGGAP